MSQVTIVGIGGVEVDRTEYLNRDVLSEFTGLKNYDPTTGQALLTGGGIYALKQILNKGIQANYGNTPTVQDYNTIVNIIGQIAALAQNGIPVTTSSGSYVSYLNGDMAQSLNDVMKSLKGAGIVFPPDPNMTDQEKIDAVKAWQLMAGFGVNQILTDAINLRINAESYTNASVVNKLGDLIPITAYPTKTFSSLLEIDYIKDGNDLLSNNLLNLQDALKLTKQALDTLAVLQNIYNKVHVQNPDTLFYSTTLKNVLNASDEFADDFFFNSTGFTNSPVWSAFVGIYKSAATAFFAPSGTSPIVPYVVGVSSQTARQLYQSKLDLENIRSKLIAANPNAATQSTSLAGVLFKVIKDISAQFATVSYDTTLGTPKDLFLSPDSTNFNQLFVAAAQRWVLDNQNGPPTTTSDNGIGKIGERLTEAIKNAQSLNDDQRGKVQQYLHLFEEFYKSAINMLQLMAQLFTKITGNLDGN